MWGAETRRIVFSDGPDNLHDDAVLHRAGAAAAAAMKTEFQNYAAVAEAAVERKTKSQRSLVEGERKMAAEEEQRAKVQQQQERKAKEAKDAKDAKEKHDLNVEDRKLTEEHNLAKEAEAKRVQAEVESKGGSRQRRGSIFRRQQPSAAQMAAFASPHDDEAGVREAMQQAARTAQKMEEIEKAAKKNIGNKQWKKMNGARRKSVVMAMYEAEKLTSMVDEVDSCSQALGSVSESAAEETEDTPPDVDMDPAALAAVAAMDSELSGGDSEAVLEAVPSEALEAELEAAVPSAEPEAEPEAEAEAVHMVETQVRAAAAAKTDEPIPLPEFEQDEAVADLAHDYSSTLDLYDGSPTPNATPATIDEPEPTAQSEPERAADLGGLAAVVETPAVVGMPSGRDAGHGATPQHGLSTNKMALITSDCGAILYAPLVSNSPNHLGLCARRRFTGWPWPPSRGTMGRTPCCPPC